MKKFFSLVLALVMALSLTTVAWGAPTTEEAALQNALNAGGTVTLTGDVTVNDGLIVPAGVTVVLDLNSKTITGAVGRDASNNRIHTLVNNGTLTVKNGTIASAGYNGGSAIYNEAGATLAIENATVLGAPLAAGGWPSYGINNYGTMTVNSATVKTYHGGIATNGDGVTVIDNANVDVGQSTATAITSYPLYTSGNGKLTVNGGTFANTATDATGTGGAIACEGGDNPIVITGGDFSGGCGLYGDFVITGGSFDRDVSAHVDSDVTTTETVGGKVVITKLPTVAKIGNKEYKTLAEALKAANAVPGGGATVTLLDNVTTSEKWDCRYNGAKFTVPVTIDGNGKTLKLTGKVFDGYNHLCAFRFEADATVKNLTIDMSEAVSGWGQRLRAISAKENLTVDNCEFYGNPNYNNTRAIIFAEGQQVHSDVEISVTNSVFKDWTYGLTDNENGKDVKSVSASENTFTDAGVQLSASEEVVFSGNTVEDASVTITSYSAPDAMEVTATNNTLDADTTVTVKNAATVTTDSNAFAAPDATLVAPAGYVVLKTTTGAEVVVPAVTMGDKYDLYLANAGMNTALTLKTPSVAGLTFEEVGAKTNKDGSGRVAYIAANNGQFFVKTTNPTVSDYAVTDAGKNTVLYYVTVAGTSAANFEYAEAVSAFTKFSTYAKCDYVTGTPVAGEDYFMAADGKVYMAAAAGTGTNYLLNGKVVSGVLFGAPETHTFTLNGYKYDATLKQNVPVSALCTKCMMNTSSIYPIAKVPATYTLYPTTGEGSNAYTVALPSAAAVVTPSTPAGDKVESAETFDAGIAMYVGMSVMAAAGSAVVIGKKKD